ncbi:site-specific integrase [Pannus brasiliensis CCIBt3594]|uniref:Site-specific integrase n=1 Tax=Pannus brasiliensis CCIBt3594 TaxID=1427578 RepID=A0AAW9QYP3_9CHRO
MPLTLAQVAVNFLDLYQHKQATQRSYLSVLSPLLDRYGSQAIDEITGDDLETYLKSLDSLAKSTYKRHRTIINSLFNYAFQESYILYNPLARLPAPDVPASEIAYLSPDRLDRLYTLLEQQQTPEGDRLHAIVRLLHRTGAKVSEVLSLNLEDINLDNCHIQLTGYRNRVRSLVYSADVSPILERYLDRYRHRDHSALFNSIHRATGEVIRLPYAVLYRDWQKLVALDPDLKSCRINDLRHTFAVERVGIISIEQLQALLGHEDIKMTLRYKKYI